MRRSSPPRGVADLKRAIAGAEAMAIATPEYNDSIPGWLKNALDWVSPPFEANRAAVGATTGMFEAASAQAKTRES